MTDFIGTNAADVFTGGIGNDTADGKGGDDRLNGAGGNDDLAGGTGADTIDGGDGDDRLYSDQRSPAYVLPLTFPQLDHGREVDTLIGGAGSDRIYAGFGDTVDGGADGTFGDYLYISFQGALAGITADFRQATLTIGGGTITGIENVSFIEGSNFDDVIYDKFGTGYSELSSLFGMGGNDALYASYHTSTLDGGDGDDLVDGRGSEYLTRIDGGAGNDTLYTAANTISSAYGGDGDDIIYSHGVTSGGAGNDLIILQQTYYSGLVNGDEGNDEIRASANGNVMAGGAGADHIIGDVGADVINSAGVDSFGEMAADSGLEHDVLSGGGGDDLIYAGLGDDVDGGTGNDSLNLSLRGAAAAVILDTAQIAAQQPFSLAGGTIQNVEHLAAIWGSSFDDDVRIASQTGAITIRLGSGDDYVRSDESAVSAYGEDGNDVIQTGAGDDFLDGGAGDDLLQAGGGNDRIEGGAGHDRLIFAYNGAEGVVVDLAAGTVSGYGNDTVSGVEDVDGTDHDDILIGDGADNRLYGGDGADVIRGGDGNDVLDGDALASLPTAIDTLDGGAGDDIIRLSNNDSAVGGAGNDGLTIILNGPGSVVDLSAVWSGGVGSNGSGTVSGFERLGYVIGSEAADTITVGTGAVTLNGADLPPVISGKGGDDQLTGGNDRDALYGDEGNDILIGLGGNDILEGGDGSDRLLGGGGDDVMNGGRDNDVFEDAGIFNNGGGSDTMNGGAGNDRFQLSRSSVEAGDVLILDGGDGDDLFYVDISSSDRNPAITSLTVNGGAGRDVLSVGGSGMDAVISLGADSDILSLGGFRATLAPGDYRLQKTMITVTDFATGDGGDVLDWAELLPTNLANWDYDANPFGSGHARLLQDGADVLLQIDLDGGADNYATWIRFQNVSASSFTAFNFDGYPPDGTLPQGLVVVGTSGQDAIDGSVAADNLRGEGGADSIHGRAGADLIDGGDGDDYLSGDLGNDTINGGAGRDYLEGGQGNDILNGGDGDDQVYDYGGSDRLSGGVGNDRMGVSYSYTLSGLASTIDGDAGADDIAVTIYGDDHVDVNAGSDNDVVTTEVETGSATVTLGDGADTLRLQQSLSYRQQTGIVTVTDFATGAGGDIVDVAPIYNSYFVKNRIGDDPFASGHMRLVQYGSDTMLQFDHDGPGQDTPYANLVRFQNVDANELTAAHFGGFTPRVVSAADAATATIMVAGTAVEGNTASLPLQLILRDVTRVVTSVTVSFAADLSTADSSDAAVPAFDRNFYLTDLPGGDHAIMLPSISLFDDLRAEGTETITIRVRATAEIFENGTDTMDVTIALQDNDFIGGAGADALSGTAYAEFFDGGAGDDTLSGMGGDDRLDGGAGADLLIGGAGDDSYFADADDTIIERAGEGNDTIYVRSSYALAAGLSIESVRTTGSSTTYAADLTGNEIANTLVGNAVANRLDGRAGADVMWGYGGDDIYFVDNAGDKVSELAGGGKDTVYTTTSYSLAAGSAVEELRTLGSATTYAADLTGNELANTMVGNAASNRLDGRAGADVMWGYAGDDYYYVDNVGDVVMERAGEGFDTIYAKADFALTRGSSIELLCTFGSSTSYAINLSGNELANTIYGNAAGNTINGGGDADVMAGFGGNDSYYVDNAGDVVIEAAGGGTDTVYTATSYTLADNSAVEELRTFGSSTSYSADLTGNGLGNTIVGNAAANTIHGGGGNDSIWGYGGNDQLFGDAGDDSFVFGPGFGRDVIADFAGNGAAAGDTIRFLPGTIGSFGALMNKAAQQGDDVVFTLDENTSLTLAGTRLAAINAQDFVFG